MKWFVSIFFFTSHFLLGQNIGIGEWQAHIPNRTAYQYTESPEYIYAATEVGLTRFQKNDLTQFRLFTTIDGLSDVDIRLLKYVEDQEVLILVYENSNIDLIYQDGRIININDILRSNQLGGDKSIDHIISYGANAYMSAGFGIIQINLVDGLITGSCFSDEAIDDISLYDNKLIALSENQIRSISLEDLPAEFIFWELWERESISLPPGSKFIENFDGNLFLATSNQLFEQIADSFQLVFTENESEIRYLYAGSENLYSGIHFNNAQDFVKIVTRNGAIVDHTSCHGSVFSALETENGRIFFGDRFNGFRTAESVDGSCETMTIESINTSVVFDMVYKNGKLAIAANGPNTSNYTYAFDRRGFSVLEDGNWIDHTENRHGIFRNEMFDYTSVEIDVSNDILYGGAYLGGLAVILPDGSAQRYDQDNSRLQGAIGDESSERVAALKLDDENGLWIGNYAAPEPIVLRTANDEWYAFPSQNSSRNIVDIEIDDAGNKWFAFRSSSIGILVFNEGELTIDGDENYRSFSTANSRLEDNTVNDLVKDRSGNIWAATDDGVVFFACGSAVFDFIDCSGVPVIDDDGDGAGDRLAQDVKVNAIEVDGANRKWIGTNGGIIVVSSSGDEELFTFTTENSPLFSNEIIAFEYEPEDGLMYISTSKGMLSYRTSSTQGEGFNRVDAYAYPNPVTPNYDGPIAIKGLAEDALVKITDASGRVVFETEALGGQAIWDGREWNGEKVASGVYQAWISGRGNQFQPDATVIKIAIVR